MALPTGDITMGQVAAELGIALPLALGDSRVRALAGIPSGDITLGSLRSKSAYTLPEVAAEPTSVDHHASVPDGTVGGTSAGLALTITGGEAPFTVSWARQSGSSFITVTGGTSATANINRTSPFSFSAIFRATITDNRSNQAVTPDIPITLSASDL